MVLRSNFDIGWCPATIADTTENSRRPREPNFLRISSVRDSSSSEAFGKRLTRRCSALDIIANVGSVFIDWAETAADACFCVLDDNRSDRIVGSGLTAVAFTGGLGWELSLAIVSNQVALSRYAMIDKDEIFAAPRNPRLPLWDEMSIREIEKFDLPSGSLVQSHSGFSPSPWYFLTLL